MGIYATFEPGNIIVSPDKDMKQIPGKLYNLEETITITEEEGDALASDPNSAGDQTDGYGGVPVLVSNVRLLCLTKTVTLGTQLSKHLSLKN